EPRAALRVLPADDTCTLGHRAHRHQHNATASRGLRSHGDEPGHRHQQEPLGPEAWYSVACDRFDRRPLGIWDYVRSASVISPAPGIVSVHDRGNLCWIG